MSGLSVECIDRMYLNNYEDAAWFFRGHRRQPFVSSVLMAPISRRFVAGLERYAQRHEIEVVQFRAGERKDDVMAERLKRFDDAEGVVFIRQGVGLPYREAALAQWAELSVDRAFDGDRKPVLRLRRRP